MDQKQILDLLHQVASGQLSLTDAQSAIAARTQAQVTPDLTGVEVTMDLDRKQRCGFPEVIYGENKDAATIVEILRTQYAVNQLSLVTRVSEVKGQHVVQCLPYMMFNAKSRTLRSIAVPEEKLNGNITIVTAGTSDGPVAEEARETLLWMGVEPQIIHDIGVAGPQRLLDHRGQLRAADVLIVVAGMEGALPSVIGGHVDSPIIAVPTSVGYGTALGGVTALLGMLNSCASNVVVVNVDAGFKAAYVAGVMLKRLRQGGQDG
ncbi:MAG: nickel pincer cofactor biosynthesis protein LarB [Planctomycetaceae bacterium]|jgi:pyridinium-3,5-biscarboxylic acid mononucleotide synthase|nr:nickel pincer cofactor biosynthesis protein LarB [Planctomycetaceae bacterium]